MSDKKAAFIEAFCEITNEVKKTGFFPDMIEEDTYLGGDLGIDSAEMLEIWMKLEQKYNIRIDDAMKRDIYTVEKVASIFLERI
jgi:acyl carrier protein